LVASVALLLAPLAASAAGLGVPDLGAASLGQGAATIAAPDDLTALYYNPAALAGHPGLRLLLDGRGIQHKVTFQRLQADGSNPDDFVSVSNGGPLRLSPALAAAYGFTLLGRPVALAAGGYPATGYSGYSFPDPAQLREELGTCPTCNAENARRTPQRYSLISNGSSSFTLALGAAVQLTDWLRAGLSLQDQLVTLKSRQSIGANPFAAGEFAGYDAILSVDAKNGFTPGAALGLSATFGDLRVGASYQLPYDVKAHGTLGVEVPQVLATLGATVSGDQTDVELHLPWYLRAGVRWVRPALEVELAFTWDGWSRYREVTFRPQGVAFQVKGNTVVIPDIHLIKGMKDSQSLRLGATVHPGELIAPTLSWLSFRAGAVGETSAVPDERLAIDQAHWARVGLSVGATARISAFSISAGYMHYFMPSKQIRDSAVVQPAPLRPEGEATVVGNGDYAASVDLVGVSLTWSLE
jgi:long-subunit fatty acid transport protein